MNKTDYVILTLILCFSIAFVVYPLKSFSYDVENGGYYEQPSGNYIVPTYANHIVELPPSGGNETPAYQTEQYSGWFCNPTTESCFYGKKQSPGYATQAQCQANCIYCRYCKKWGGFFGPYGCYGIKKCTNNIDECTTNAQCNGEATPPPTIPKYSCSSTNGCVISVGGSYTTSNCDNKCVKRCVGTSCQYNDNTSNSTCAYSSQCAGTKYSCSSTNGCVSSAGGSYTTSNCGGRCVKRCVGTSCQYNDNISNSTCTYNANCVELPPTSEPPLEDCRIYDFDLPDRAWVGYPITGSWSTNEYCISGDITCSSDTGGECYWADNDLTPILGGKHSFTIGRAGEYTYTFTAYGQSGSDQMDVKTKTIPAYNLPWWREIIPVLTGFLRGVWE